MEDDVPVTNGMNLDLNLGPMLPSSPTHELGSGSGLQMDELVSLDDWIERYPSRRRVSDVLRRRVRQRWRWQQLHVPSDPRNVSVELMGNSAGISGPQPGEGSTAAATTTERTDIPVKVCENTDANIEDETFKKEDQGEIQNDDKSFFDCNICLDLASEPVVTCCGHLFCWPCLYRWLHVHSESKECPVCKGEVTAKNVTPIYGRGMNPRSADVDSSDKIPTRPQARRVESLRQSIQRNSFSLSLEEMFRRLGSRFASPVDLFEAQDPEHFSERSNSLLNRFLTSRGTRRENNLVVPSDDVVDLTHDRMDNVDIDHNRHSQISSLLLRRSQSHRTAAFSSLPSSFNPAERFVEAYFRSHHTGRNQEQPLPVDDRDSFSSIGAVIHSESQTLDTAVEIDSTVSLSTSSSRRRNDVSRASDVDSGDSRARRRRRLN